MKSIGADPKRTLLYASDNNNDLSLLNMCSNRILSDTNAYINIKKGATIFYELILHNLDQRCLDGNSDCRFYFQESSPLAAVFL